MTAMSTPVHTAEAPPSARFPLADALRIPQSTQDTQLAQSEILRVRNAWIAIGSGILNLLAIAALLVMLPLKRIEPVFVFNTPDGGVGTARMTAAESYKPSEAHLKYFLGHVTKSIWTLDRLTTERDIQAARRHFVRGKADGQLAHWIADETPIGRMVQDPSLGRAVRIHGVSILKTGAMVDFSTIETTGRDPVGAAIKRQATYHFSIMPPTGSDDEDLVFANPAGLYITSLEFSRKL